MMNNENTKITLIEAFDAMRHFLEVYWKRGGMISDDIASLLGSLNRNEDLNTMPLDPAMWEDWIDAVYRKDEDSL